MIKEYRIRFYTHYSIKHYDEEFAKRFCQQMQNTYGKENFEMEEVKEK